MHACANHSDTQSLPAASLLPDWPADPQIERCEPRNIGLLAIHQVIFRCGWIFKTESVIVPAFLDWVAGPGAGFLRGFLPVISRLGQSVPPVLCAESLRSMRLKKHALAGSALAMSLPFAVLAVLCRFVDMQQMRWMALVFLLLYAAFFSIYGLYQLSFCTVQGKLVRPTRRGLLLLISAFWGALPAMALAIWLLPGWLEMAHSNGAAETQAGGAPPRAMQFGGVGVKTTELPSGASPAPRGAMQSGGVGYSRIFGFTALCFLLSAVLVALLAEPSDVDRPSAAAPALGSLAETWRALREDANLRRLVGLVMLFGAGLIVFPHYQAMARERLGLKGGHLVWWIVTQNAAVGLVGLVVGPLADRYGNRLTMRVLILGSACPPLLAVWLAGWSGQLGARLFWLVFIPMGITPLVLRAVSNYTLEICRPAEHPRYLSTVSLCVALPLLFSPLVGWLVDMLGYEVVFLAAAGSVVLGGLLTFRLDEPRWGERKRLPFAVEDT